MTEEELDANALSDPDNPPLTREELAEMRWSMDLRDVRGRFRLTQEQFSEQFQIPLGTLRDWEQNRSQPDKPARVLLRVISRHPEAVIDALRD
jgi:putative transcriptional regulator